MNRTALFLTVGLTACSPRVDEGSLPAEPQPLEGDVDVASHEGATQASTDDRLDFFPYISAAGDLDGDGCDDIVLSGGSAFSENYGHAPVATVVYGEPAPLRRRSWGHASTKIFGETTQSRAVPVGDLDGDGFPELALQTERRGLRIFRGGARTDALHLDDAPLVIDSDNRELLLAPSGRGGDVTGDGLADLVVGRYGDARSVASPTVYLLPGAEGIFSTSPLRFNADSIASVSDPTAHLTPALVEDLDGDGVADLVLASVSADQTQTDLWILPGGPAAANLQRSAAVSSAFEGYVDVSSLMPASNGPRDLLVSGVVSHLWTHPAEELSTQSLTVDGRAVGAGDVDGDAIDDILVLQGDTALLLYGPLSHADELTSPDATLHFPSGELDVRSAAPVGDFNCDGYDDIGYVHSGSSSSDPDAHLYVVYGAPR